MFYVSFMSISEKIILFMRKKDAQQFLFAPGIAELLLHLCNKYCKHAHGKKQEIPLLFSGGSAYV